MYRIFRDVIAENRRGFIINAILKIIMTAFLVVLPYMNSNIINNLTYNPNTSNIGKSIIAIGCILIAKVIVSYFYTLISSQLTKKCTYELIMKTLQHLRNISTIDYQKFDPIYLADRIKKDIEIITFFF